MIGLCNIDKNISSKLAKFLDVKEIETKDTFPHFDGIFIDWTYKSHSKEWAKQAALIDIYTKKKIPIVIFDRYFSITRKEYDWLKKFKVFFFEPAINNRRGFAYLPQWITKPDFKHYSKDREKREFDLGYKCNNLNNNLKSFENYYLKYTKLYPEKKVIYSTQKINNHKEKYYKDFELKRVSDFSYSQSSFTIAIDSQKNYDIGYLDQNILDAMNQNCLPLLPVEHKYFNAMFTNIIVKNMYDLSYYVEQFGRIKEILIEEIYEKIEKYYPEFMIDNTVEVIKNCFIK